MKALFHAPLVTLLIVAGHASPSAQTRLPDPFASARTVLVVHDVDEVRGLAPAGSKPRCLRVLGYHAPGDGGGGDFYWDAASTEDDDGGITLQPTASVGAGRWKRLQDGRSVSVAWFGATPDDASDDHAAIQAAIDHCQEKLEGVGPDFRVVSSLFVPRGAYLVSATLRIKDGVDLFGEDASTTALVHTGTGDLLLVENDDLDEDGVPDPVFHVRVRRLSLQGNGGPQGENAQTRFGIFLFHGIRGCALEDVVVTRCQTGIFLRRCNTARIVGCTVMFCTQNALKWENATAGTISGCRFDVNPGGNHCAFVTFDHTNGEETVGFLVESSSFQGSALAGLYCRDVGNLTVTSCFFENNNRNDAGYAALHLEEVGGQPYDNGEHVVNVVGGFFTPGSGGGNSSRAIYAENVERVNLIGVDVRGLGFQYAIETGPSVKNVNLIGCKFHGRPRSIPPTTAVAEMGSD